MVHNNVENNTDTVLMSSVDHLFELCLCTVVLIELGVVKAVVTVVSVVSKALLTVATYCVAVNLLKPTCYPDCVYAQVIKVSLVDFLGDTFEVTTLESSNFVIRSLGAILVKTSVIAVVVCCVTVVETVCQKKINRCVVPCEVISCLGINCCGLGYIGCCSLCCETYCAHRYNKCECEK